MNPWQMAQQIKAELQAVAWPGGSQDPVFGTYRVFVTAGTPSEETIPPGFPFAMVILEGYEPDDEHPELLTQRFRVFAVAEVAGDPLGEHAVIGSSVSELGVSAGRGIAEIVERVRSSVQDLTGADGAHVQLGASSGPTTETIGRGRHIVAQDVPLQAWCLSALYYSPPQQLTHTGTAFNWQGAHCSDRFDFLQYKLVRKAGSSPSTDPSDGTLLYTGTTASFTGAATSGNTYTVFAEYDARGIGTAEDASEPEVGSYLVVA